jgi:hypothetical protein
VLVHVWCCCLLRTSCFAEQHKQQQDLLGHLNFCMLQPASCAWFHLCQEATLLVLLLYMTGRHSCRVPL